jgi:hypothetical protein
MEYASAAQAHPTDKPMPELGRLKAAAERVSSAARTVEYFLERFNGPAPETAEGTAQPPSTYRNDLDAVFMQIDRLEAAVKSLDRIG